MKNILILLFLTLYSIDGNSQLISMEEDQSIEITLQNGRKISGKVKSVNNETIMIESVLGDIIIKRENIKKVVKSIGEVMSRVYQNFNDSYFSMPSALPVGKGNHYYKTYNLVYNQFNLGVSDNFSLGVGFESLSFFNGQFSQLFVVSPKYSIAIDKNHLGIGTSLYFLPSSDEIAGLTYINYTIGSETKNLTLGSSFAYVSDVDDLELIFNISLMYPISKKTIFISELLLGSFDGNLLNIGTRFMSKSGISFDACAVFPSNETDFFAYPLLVLSLPF